jgi:hypothetical protein
MAERRRRVLIVDDDAAIREQLREEGVTDPDQVRGELRTRVHDAMEQEYGEMPGPQVGMGAGHEGWEGADGPRDGTGYRHGAGAG